MSPTLTPKQKSLLEYIEHFTQKMGYSPSQSEIAKNFGFKSLGTVQNYLVRLQRQGVLKKTWNAKRSAEIIPMPSSSETVPLPLLGKVAAGRAIEGVTEGHIAPQIHVPKSLLPPTKTGSLGKDYFVLEVQGDSMIEAGILNKDHVIIKKTSSALNGQVVVASVNGEATIKRFFKKGDQIELHSENAAYAPIQIGPNKSFCIEGVLIALIRHYS